MGGLLKRVKGSAFAALAAVMVTALAASNAAAQFGVFDSEILAQLRCPNDEVVWLDFKKRRYYTKNQRLYGQGRDASFVCRKEASSGGYNRARVGFR